MIDALTRFQNEQRSIEYVKLEAAQAGQIDPPSPETLAAYFDDHKTQFRAPEYRKMSFVAITPEEIGKWSEVSDEDAKKAFELRRDKLGTPGKARSVRRSYFPTPTRRSAARDRITGGLSFDDLAKERNLERVGRRSRAGAKSAILDPARCAMLPSRCRQARSASRSRADSASRWSRSARSSPASSRTTRASRPRSSARSATERARTKVAELHDKMEDERGGGASVIEAAQKLGLAAVTIDAVDRSGRAARTASPSTNIPQGLDVVSQAFNSDVGVDNDPIQFNGGYVWYDVLGITPSRERNLDEVKDQVEARWREDQISAKLRTKATEMVQKLDKGGKLADEATAFGAKVETASDFPRDATVPACPRRRSPRPSAPPRMGSVKHRAPAAASGSSSASPTSPMPPVDAWPRLT